MKHLDLFSGIGGFAYAADTVFGDVEHVFCDYDKFCQQVLKKHWPESEIYSDIRTLTDTRCEHGESRGSKRAQGQTPQWCCTAKEIKRLGGLDLLTGGFPCQPFSAAGLRRGTADERHLWPEMLRVIQLTRPTWVIAENVYGLLDWNDGLVFEQVCTDLEAAGYEVQPFIIPAVALDAPHRRYRVWFIGHAKHDGRYGAENTEGDTQGADRVPAGQDELRQPKGTDSLRPKSTADVDVGRLEGTRTELKARRSRQRDSSPGWDKDWHEVAAEFCRVDDGLPRELGFIGGLDEQSDDKETITKARKSVWQEMRMVRRRAAAEPTSLKDGGGGNSDTLHSLPRKRTSEDWYRHLGETEEEKELRNMWDRVCTAPFKEAQHLFPELSKRIREIERKKTVGQNGFKLSKSAHRKEQLKAYGNAIVPQVAMQIMESIKASS